MNKLIARMSNIVAAAALIVAGLYSQQTSSVSAAPRVESGSALMVSGTQSIPQTIVYKDPVWGSSSTALTGTEIGTRFDTAILSRNQMQALVSKYTPAGVNNLFIYLIADGLAGPPEMYSLSAQAALCSDAQKSYQGISNNVAMETGDFCKVHDAIITHTCLAEYPDICPTENWFLHKADGSRYLKSSGLYRPNPGDPAWRMFFARRALREVALTDRAHPPISGVDGIFIDDLNASFPQLVTEGGSNPPQEYATNELYDAAMLGFVQVVSQAVAGYPLIGNLNSMSTQWSDFDQYLSGGFSESWATDWGATASTSRLLKELSLAETWLAGGNTLYVVTQGDPTGANNLFGLGMYLLIAQPGSEYRYSDHSSYAHYYEAPEYYYQLGLPVGARAKVSDTPLVYQRCFQNGSVIVDLSAKTTLFKPTCDTAVINTATPLAPSATPLPPTATATNVSPSATPTSQPPTPTTLPFGQTVLNIRVATANDDAEEYSSGGVHFNSTDLELVYDTSSQVVGLRFIGVNIPTGARIVNAYIQFKVDEKSSEVITLNIQGEASANAAAFAKTTRNISARPRTAATVTWTPPAWPTLGAAGPDQMTPNLTAVIQELVNQSGWMPGNAIVIIITGSTGKRVAKAFDGDAAGAPLLHIEYAVP